MLLLLDNYDSFTYNLLDYFLQCGAEVEVVRNDEIDITTIPEKYKGIILSPGPGTPSDYGSMMKIIQEYHNKLPFFGVCLGMQALGLHFGAKLVRANFPMHGKESILDYDHAHPMFENIASPLKVCRYHSLLLSKIPSDEITTVARTIEDEPMAISHKNFPIWAVQFHPEAILTPQGLSIINNWLSCFSL